MYFSLILIDNSDVVVNLVPLPKQSNNTISLFIFLQTAMRISIPGHVFLNFSGTAQNWMAIVVPPHCPLPRGSSFLELDY